MNEADDDERRPRSSDTRQPQPVSHVLPVTVTQPAVGAKVLGFLTTVSAVLLLVGTFLPWIRHDSPSGPFTPSPSLDHIARLYISYTGFRVDTMGMVVLACGLAALGLAVSGLLVRRSLLAASAALPGGVALLACVLFLSRLNDIGIQVGKSIGSEIGDPGLSVRFEPGYGWFIDLFMAIAILGLGVAHLVRSRKTHQL